MSQRRATPWLYLRAAAFWVVFAAATIVWGVLIGTVGWLFPPAWRYQMARSWCAVSIWALRLICGVRWRVEGREHLPDEPVIFFSKHQSTWETLALVMLLPPQVHVLKRELLWIPFFGWGLAAIRPIAIDRSGGHAAVEQLVGQGRQRLASGRCVMVFPEGTRVLPGHSVRYRMGGAVLAAETGAKVVPLAHNAGELWPRHSFLKWPGEITVAIGPPIETTGKKAD
ncbi:MAG: lysophospholipid acyltransferase family protein, partial [Halofilum sp. (in: g-proteobacteria)]